MVHFDEFFEKPEACGQTVLADRLVLLGQKLVENAKIHISLSEVITEKVKLVIRLLQFKASNAVMKVQFEDQF